MTATKHNASSNKSFLRIVVTGSECTGKTTLASAIAAKLDTPFSSESARDYVNELDRAVQFSDVEPIARRQIAMENSLLGGDSRMYIFDTDLFSTLIYSRLYFGRCPSWIEPLCRARRADLYLLCGIDLPWIKDGFQRGQDTPKKRQHAHDLFTNVLNENGCSVRAVSGLNNCRLECAISTIETWLSRGTTMLDRTSNSP
jgi:NadR type nicotinamide-nucleotide adenylyltransferase